MYMKKKLRINGLPYCLHLNFRRLVLQALFSLLLLLLLLCFSLVGSILTWFYV